MTRVVIDARLAGHSGIGVYLDQLLPRVLPHLEPWRPVVLARTAQKRDLASHLGPNAEVRGWDIPPLGLSNLWSVPPIASPRDLVWTPHFNVPLLRTGPLAVTLHDVLPIALPKLAGRARSVPVRLWLNAVRARAGVVFCVSEFTRSEAIAHGSLDATRLVVTSLGVDDRWHAPPPPPIPGSSDERLPPTIISIGLMKRHKNLARLLQAFDRVKARIPHRLILIARHAGLRTIDPDVMPWVRSLGDRVELFEHLALPELIMRTRSAEFAALPSLYEGFGLPALEAMTVGTPVLAARAAALPEVCGDAAVYCDPESIEDIARGLLLLAADAPLRARLSAAGIARSKAFSWDRCASATVCALADQLIKLDANAHR